MPTCQLSTPTGSISTATRVSLPRERATLRRLIGAGSGIVSTAFHPEGRDSEALLDEAEREVFAIRDGGVGGDAPRRADRQRHHVHRLVRLGEIRQDSKDQPVRRAVEVVRRHPVRNIEPRCPVEHQAVSSDCSASIDCGGVPSGAATCGVNVNVALPDQPVTL